MNDKKKKPGKRLPPFQDQKKLKYLIMWLLIGVLIFWIYYGNQLGRSRPDKLEYSQWRQMAQSEQIFTLTVNGQTGTGQYQIDGGAGEYEVTLPADLPESFYDLTDGKNIKVKFQQPSRWMDLFISFAPIILFVGLLWFLFYRQMKGAGKGALSFGKSRARLDKGQAKVTFEDVAGVPESKEELEEIIAFLKDPKKFQRLGGRIPKGVILIGPPGTGKTLLARAVAGEAEVPFFSISGSDFVEMFVGVGASRVRDMFEQSRKNAPCIIFLDEIDAVGRHRGSGLGGGHDEREQTLNQLLVEMDGFDTKEGIILIAATNRPDVLDPALLRPGRFDRQIVIDMPDIKGREEILKVHAQKIILSDAVNLSRIARGTPGFSGADLANLINEAALLAARHDKEGVGMEELEEARDKVRWGRERRSRVMDEEDKKVTAYHEAGHALVIALIPETEPLHKVTIIPRGIAYLGATMQLPEKDRYLEFKKKLLGQITGLFGGRVAEELIFDDITAGARSDIKVATRIARNMVCEWGMSDKLGPVTYGDREEHLFLGREITRSVDYSEATAVEIDKEVKTILDQCFRRAREILTANRDKLIALAEGLLDYEVLNDTDIDQIVKTGRLKRRKGRTKVRSASKRDSRPKEKEAPEESEPARPVRPPSFSGPIPEET